MTHEHLIFVLGNALHALRHGRLHGQVNDHALLPNEIARIVDDALAEYDEHAARQSVIDEAVLNRRDDAG